MGELEKRTVLKQIFRDHDVEMTGELTEVQLQQLYTDIRLGGISIPQICAAIAYVCVDNVCEESELFELLQEMDRRYFLVQDFRWEFSMLDVTKTDTIREEQAKWFVKTVHGQYFSQHRWERFLRLRAVPGSGVSFAEIEVMLCSIPSKEEWLDEQMENRQDKLAREKKLRQMEMVLEEEKRRRKTERELERRLREKEEKKKAKEEDRRRREEEAERFQRQKEKEEAEERRRKLQEEEDRGRREAEEREDKRRDEEEEKRKKEIQRLQEVVENQRREEEDRRRKELEEAKYCELMLEDAVRGEIQANSEAEGHQQRAKDATDAALRKEAEEAERRARLRAKEFRNKRIRYNLKVAIKRRDRERLPPAVDEFKKAKLPDDDMDLEKAERLLREWQAVDGLKLAMTKRHLQELEQAINFVKKHGFDYLLTQELIEAHKILLQLRRLERIRAEILELKQSTVAEIKSYQKPPVVVHIVMTGTFLVLGNKEHDTKNWKNVQILVGKTGKDGLKRRCLELDPGHIKRGSAARAKELLGQFELDDVRDVSAGAATFFVWSWTMIEEMEARIEAKKLADEEAKIAAEKKRQEDEEKRQREAEIAAAVDAGAVSPDPGATPPPGSAAVEPGATPPGGAAMETGASPPGGVTPPDGGTSGQAPDGSTDANPAGPKQRSKSEERKKVTIVAPPDGSSEGGAAAKRKPRSKSEERKDVSVADQVQQKIKEANKMANRKAERVIVTEKVETRLVRK